MAASGVLAQMVMYETSTIVSVWMRMSVTEVLVAQELVSILSVVIVVVVQMAISLIQL
jgi:hypothetical protein